MKIGIVCFNFFIAGGARLALDLAKSLGKLGHKVVIYTPDNKAESYRDIMAGLDIKIIKPRLSITAFSSKKPRTFVGWIIKKIREEVGFLSAARKIVSAMESDFDIVSVHDSSYVVGYLYKRKLNPRTRVIWNVNGQPFLYISRNNFLIDIVGRIYHWTRGFFNKKYLRAVDESIVLDTYNKQWLEKYGVKNISIIRGGIDFGKFYAPVKDFTKKATNKSVKLFALGALNPYRRFEDVIMAIYYLRQWGYNAEAEIICNNIWHEDGVRDNLISLVQKHHLENAVRLHFTGVPDEELRRTYSNSDVFVQAVYVTPPGNHGWGLVNFESMASGLPLIVCRASTATEVLEDNRTALFVDPLSPEQIARKVESLILNPKLYKEIALAGQSFVKNNLSWEKYAQEVLEVFKASQK